MEQWTDWVSPGVVTSEDLGVSASTPNAMSVTVAGAAQGTTGGNAWLPGGYRFCSDAPQTLTIATADPSNPRIDLIVAAINTTTTPYTPIVQSVTGIASAAPVAPSLPAGYVGIVLAHVYVAPGATGITQANITDERILASLQGTVAPTGNVAMSNGTGFVTPGGATLSTGSGGATWGAKTNSAAADAFNVTDPLGVVCFRVAGVGVGGAFVPYGRDGTLLEALSGGYKVESGTAYVTTTQNTTVAQAVTFPTPYTSAPVVLATYAQNNNAVYVSVSAVTPTGFSLGVENTGSSGVAAISWLAIGS